MMNIVIIGAGNIGQYMAELLSKSEHHVIVVDIDKKKLESLSSDIDVTLKEGSGTDWQLLDNLLELSPDWLIALTNDDETNLVSCSIAKHLGYPNTIARIGDNKFLNRTRLDFGRIFDVDYFIGPELLVAEDMLKYMFGKGAIAVEHFAHGAVQLRTLKIPKNWKKEKTLSQLDIPAGMMVGLIKRDSKIIFPHGKDLLLPDDEVTFIGETDAMEELSNYLGIDKSEMKSVVIVGGTKVGINLAQLLEKKGIRARLIDKDYNQCVYLADKLLKTTIVNFDATDIGFIREDKIAEADLVAMCTRHDETNLLGALLLKEEGAKEVITMLSSSGYESISKKIGIHQVSSTRTSAANQILSLLLSGSTTSLISLYDNQAEVIEIRVSADSEVAGIPLSELGPLLPTKFLIAMIENRGRIMVANGSRIISPGDTVIVITDPKHVHELERIF